MTEGPPDDATPGEDDTAASEPSAGASKTHVTGPLDEPEPEPGLMWGPTPVDREPIEGLIPLPPLLLHPARDAERITVELIECSARWPGPAPRDANWLEYGLRRRYVVPGRALVVPTGHQGTLQLVAPEPLEVPPGPNGRPQVDLVWRVHWTTGATRHRLQCRLSLDLRRMEGNRMDSFVWRAARARSPQEGLILAVDFGTTATTATAYLRTHAERGQANAWEPRQVKTLIEQMGTVGELVPSLAADHGGSTGRAIAELRSALPTIPEIRAVDDRVLTDLETALTGTERALHELALNDADTAQVAWRRWHEMFDAVYAVPPLFHSGLEPIDLTFDGRSQVLPTDRAQPVSSRLRILEGGEAREEEYDPRSPWPQHPLGVHLRGEDAPVPQSALNRTLVLRDLKRMYVDPGRMLEALPEPLQPEGTVGSRLTGGDLIVGAIAWITERAEAYATALRGGGSARKSPVTWLTLTYPTAMPPHARNLLTRMLQHGLNIDTVYLRVDEAVAAAMYHVFRHAADPDWGLDGMRAFSRRVARPDLPAASSAPAWWRQNTLVIDVGGGTTDIALVATFLSDRGGPSAGNPQTSGHRFALVPQVLASAGHARLGGDLLTLKVFYWIKAVLVDHARARGTAPDRTLEDSGHAGFGSRVADLRAENPAVYGPLLDSGLAVGLIQRSDEGPAKATQAYLLSQLIPTRWEGGDSRRDAFEVLWATAEEAKKILGAGGEYKLPDTLFTDMYERDSPELHGVRDLLTTLAAVTALMPDDFRRLVEPTFERIVAMSLDVSHRALTADGSLEPIDRVVLSGRSCGMQLVEDLVRKRVVSHARQTGTDIVPEVFVERLHPKQSTSIGACWVTQMRQHTVDRDAERQLVLGSDVIDFSIAGLVMSAPSDFLITGNNNAMVEMIRIGQPFEFTTETGEASARSAGTDIVQPLLQVHRSMGGKHTVSWGKLDVAELAQRNGLTANKQARDWSGPPIRYRMELMQDLTVRLHFFLGFEVHRIPEGVKTVAPRSDLTGQPFSVRITGDPDWVLPGRSGELQVDLQSLPDRVVFAEQGLERPGDAVPARLWNRPLPAPFRDRMTGRAFWRCRWELGRQGFEIEVDVPDGNRAEHYYTTFLGDGTIVLTDGYPAYLSARSLRDVVHQPGRVFTTTLDENEAFSQAEWAPFTGRH